MISQEERNNRKYDNFHSSMEDVYRFSDEEFNPNNWIMYEEEL